jgi:hypothetical protein
MKPTQILHLLAAALIGALGEFALMARAQDESTD